MAARHGSSAKLPVSEELVITRVLDAPREAVWKAWTDPALHALVGAERLHKTISDCEIGWSGSFDKLAGIL
jgi:hypothetical protein